VGRKEGTGKDWERKGGKRQKERKGSHIKKRYEEHIRG